MNRNVMTSEEEKIILLTDEQAQQTLEDFYRSVAQLIGHEETKNTLYDCSKIWVASNVWDAIIRAYQEKQPDVEEKSIITLLVISGPKADKGLGRNEVKIQSGFINS